MSQLLQNGADSNIQNEKGETCLQLTESPQIRILLGGKLHRVTCAACKF